jgi:hypothetical protein
VDLGTSIGIAEPSRRSGAFVAMGWRSLLVVMLKQLTTVAAFSNVAPPQGVFHNESFLAEMIRWNEALLQDHILNGSQRNGKCSRDMTHKMDACLQECNMWCWAAVETMARDYYTGHKQCESFMCKAATYKLSSPDYKKWPDNCCPVSDHCSAKDGSGIDGDYTCDIGGGEDDVIKGLSHFTGGSFQQKGPLSQADLDKALNSGRVVLMTVNWEGGHGGHWLMIGGCGNGHYYVHDPYAWWADFGGRTPPTWQKLTYDQVLRYPCPGKYKGKHMIGDWVSSVFWSWSASQEHAAAVKQADQQRELAGNPSLRLSLVTV